MKVLLLSPRFPWPPFTGDRLRATIWLTALAREHEVTLVSPPGVVPESAPRIEFRPARRSIKSAVTGAMRVLRGAPLQSLLAAPFDFASEMHGDFDATIVLLSRLDACVRDSLPQTFRIFDAIDSLGRSMDERAREASPLLRWLWRVEAKRVKQVEATASLAYDRVLAVSIDEAHELRGEAIANGVAIAPLGNAPRSFDYAFWGRLAYFANRDAAAWLVDELWPAIRAQRPNATLLLAGAEAPAGLRALHGRDGITVQSPVGDMAMLARQVKVALFPVRYGTGQSNKVLEAAEAGCAVVATAKAMRGLDPLQPHAFIANDTPSLVRGALAALSSDSKPLRAIVETTYARETTLARMAALLDRAEAAA